MRPEAALDCEVVLTTSGAPAMLDRRTGEVMHPIVGPLVEAERLYLAPSRLRSRLSEPDGSALVLFDVGLGAGSNSVAAFRAAHGLLEPARRLSIVSFDRSRAALKLALECEQSAQFGFDGSARAAARTLLADGRCLASRVEWRLHEGELPDSLSREPEATADIVFWDPFSPLANPELWNLDAFVRLRRSCRARATVHTYCAATRVRSALLLAGFSVGLGVSIGPGRDATVAALDPGTLERPLDRRWLERLRRSSAPFPEDAPGNALERIGGMAQFR